MTNEKGPGNIIPFKQPVTVASEAAQEQAPAIQETVIRSEYDEAREFPKEEILDLIYEIAKEEGISKSELSVEREAYGELQQNSRFGRKALVLLVVRVSPERARSQGWDGIIYKFDVSGRFEFGSREYNYWSSRTSITRDNISLKHPDGIAGGTVAEYVHATDWDRKNVNEAENLNWGGHWTLKPGTMNPELELVP